MDNSLSEPKSFEEQLDDALFDSIVALGVREGGTVTDLDTLIIDRRKAIDLILALIEKEVIGEDNHEGDPEIDSSIPMQFTSVGERNRLRSEQRNILKGGNK